MPFEVPNISLTGNISATVHEHGGVLPTTIIEIGTPWAINVSWSMTGTNFHMVAGTWHVHANLESIGPGRELSLVDFADPACSSLALPSADGNYFCHFDVPGNFLTPADVPHQSLPMKLVVVLTYRDVLGHLGPIAGYYEGPILQFYNDEHV
jgi:hypothetical protein